MWLLLAVQDEESTTVTRQLSHQLSNLSELGSVPPPSLPTNPFLPQRSHSIVSPDVQVEQEFERLSI